MKNPIGLAALIVAAGFSLIGCGTTTFSHSLPVLYRTTELNVPKHEAVEACRSAFSELGFDVTYADTVSGLIVTDYLETKRYSPEIGGVGRSRISAWISATGSGSIVTAELLFETGATSGWSPQTVSLGHARNEYSRLFQIMKKHAAAGPADTLEVAP